MKASRIALEAAGWLCWLLGVWLLWRDLFSTVGVYDEGIVLTDAWLLLQGQVPFRDFYSNYPPGTFLLVAALFKIFGASVAPVRWLGLLARALAGIWAGKLAGELSGRRFFAPVAGVVTLWLSAIGTVPFAYVLAVHTVLLALLLVLRAWKKGTRNAWILAGVVLGLVSWVRSDLFGLFAVPASLVLAAIAVKYQAWKPEVRAEWMTWAPWLAVGLAVAIVPFWLVVFATGGRQVFNDLAFDQSHYVLPARKLPFPTLAGFKSVSWAPFRVPLWFAYFEGAVVMTFLGPVFAALAVAFPGRTGTNGRIAAALVGAFALSVMPQMMGRTDLHHAVYTVTPAVVLLGVLFARNDSRTGLNVVLTVLMLAVVWINGAGVSATPAPGPRDQPGFERAAGREVFAFGARQEVQRFIDENSQPGDPIYVGLMNHGFVFISEIDLYFFLQRTGATRYMQFDPNVVNRRDVQQRMAEEIRERNAKVVILSGTFARSGEPNDSSKEGAHFLDEYLRTNFHVAKVVPPYVMMLRND